MGNKSKKTNPRRQPVSKADVKKAKKESEYNAMTASIAVPLMALHDVYGFGPSRLSAVCDRMLKLYRDIEAGEFTAEQANAWLWDYAGIKVSERGE